MNFITELIFKKLSEKSLHIFLILRGSLFQKILTRINLHPAQESDILIGGCLHFLQENTIKKITKIKEKVV